MRGGIYGREGRGNEEIDRGWGGKRRDRRGRKETRGRGDEIGVGGGRRGRQREEERADMRERRERMEREEKRVEEREGR